MPNENPQQQQQQPPPPSPEKPPPQSSLTQIGTLVVLGAVAANVFGFRYSRWAVGKELHRAWERRAANRANHQSHARHQHFTEQHRRAEQQKQRVQQQRRAEQQRRAAQHDARAQADRAARDATHAFHEQWERTFGAGTRTRTTWQSHSFRVDFDPRQFERFVRENRRAPFGIDEQMLQQMLRAAAQAAQNANNSRADRQQFDPFEFWQHAQTDAGAHSARQGVFRTRNSAKYYADLGLSADASDAQVKAAYRKEVMKWHPDKYRGSNPQLAERRFREVTEAYNALTNK